MEALLDEENVEFVAAVERHEEFEEIAVSDDEPGGQHDLGHVVQVANGDELFEAIGLAQRNRDGQDHGKARIDGAGHEIRRKDRGMPAGNYGDCEIETHYSVHGENQRRCESGEKQIRRLVTMPVTRGTSPAHGQHAVNNLHGLLDGAVAERGQVRDETHEPEKQRNRAVGRNRKHVPDQRAGVTNTDPPHEIDDRKTPADGDVDAPDADALDDEPADGDGHQAHKAEGNRKSDKPAERRWAGQYNRADLVRDRPVGIPRSDYRGQPADFRRIERWLPGAHADSNSGFGLRTAARYVVRGRAFSPPRSE